MRAINLWAVHWNVLKCKRARISASFLPRMIRTGKRKCELQPGLTSSHCLLAEDCKANICRQSRGKDTMRSLLGLVANFRPSVGVELRGADRAKNYLPGCPKHCWCQQIPFQRMPTANKKIRSTIAKKKQQKMWKKSKINAQALRNELPKLQPAACPADVLFAYRAHN